MSTTTSKLTQQEEKACIILSDLVLDAKHIPSTLNSAIRRLRPLGIPVPTLEDILRYDVFPVLIPIIYVPGACMGFDEESWLIEQVQARRSAAGLRLALMKSAAESVLWYPLGLMIRSDWNYIKEGLNKGTDVTGFESTDSLVAIY